MMNRSIGGIERDGAYLDPFVSSEVEKQPQAL
ncbi:MAG: hypothetical protein ACJAWY_003486, partial [Sphingomonas echinoides]